LSNDPELLPVLDIGDHQDLAAGEFSAWLAATLSQGDAAVACGDCNACCKAAQFIHVTPQDQAALAHIPAELLFAAPGAPAGVKLLGYNEQGHCPMLVDDACSIYAHRPQACRVYDCRIFAAANIAAGDGARTAVSQTARRWRFSYADNAAQQAHAQVVQQAQRVLANRQDYPNSLVDNPTALALYAVRNAAASND